jgi:hypothetical protein
MKVIINNNNHLKAEGNWNLKEAMEAIQVHKRVKIFFVTYSWRMSVSIWTIGAMVHKGVQCDDKCPCCNTNEENECQCFFVARMDRRCG